MASLEAGRPSKGEGADRASREAGRAWERPGRANRLCVNNCEGFVSVLHCHKEHPEDADTEVVIQCFSVKNRIFDIVESFLD